MWSNFVIQDLIDEQTKNARRLKLEPATVQAALDSYETTGRLKVVPFLGEYSPKGWEATETTFFVDISGFGREYEPALTISQFLNTLETLNPADGLGIVEQGQFQVVVRLYQHK